MGQDSFTPRPASLANWGLFRGVAKIARSARRLARGTRVRLDWLHPVEPAGFWANSTSLGQFCEDLVGLGWFGEKMQSQALPMTELRQREPFAAGRRAQIDGLRALAMVGVLYVHFNDINPVTEDLRVSLFFVISGFIITHILFSAVERGGRIRIWNFYVRRMLRLFPALFVLVLAAAVLDADGFREEAFWHLFQMSNIRFSMLKEVHPWVVGHLWSLNNLEQFYLIWPVVILSLSLARIYVLTITIITATVLLHVHSNDLGVGGWWLFFVFNFDPIAMGAFAYLLQRNAPVAAALRAYSALIASLAVIASPFFLWPSFSDSLTYRVMCEPALAVIVVGAFWGYRGPLGWALGCGFSRFVSKISYGVFMYHLLLWWAVGQIFPWMLEKSFLTFALMSTLSVAVATASWYLIEEPISRLKRHFPVSDRPESSVPKAEDALPFT
jgi:peptidoglycan/LPS O-acetylase OafA/YrhL